jgi:hypothetical protein
MYVRHVDRFPSLFKPQPSGCPDDFGSFLDSLALKLDFSIELHYLTLPGRTKPSTPGKVFQTYRSNLDSSIVGPNDTELLLINPTTLYSNANQK